MGWALPNETPAQYQKRMQTLQQDMRKQMAAIAAETDPTKRDALIRQHYETMYRNMQTMRGMGWMWTQVPPARFRMRVRPVRHWNRSTARSATRHRRLTCIRPRSGQT